MLNQPIQPMLLQPLKPTEIKSGWLTSLKWDGFRILIHYDHGNVRAFTRHGTEVTDRFPELRDIKLNVKSAILDGECIAFDLSQPQGNPPKIWWDDAMTRFNTKKASSVKLIAQTLKAHFPVWDILQVDGESLLSKSFIQRREILSMVVQASAVISVTPLYDEGDSLFSRTKELGFEGIVQYNPKGRYYLDKRPKDVIVKIKAYQSVICQISSIRIKGDFGWGLNMNGVYVGVLEFPPDSESKQKLYKLSKQLTRSKNKDWLFLEPVINCKIKFQCYTKDGKLRSPKFEGFCSSF